MARGPAGYGRYDDDPAHVGCPWAKSDMTPCVARDGHLAITTRPAVCVGCGNTLPYLLADLADDWPRAGDEPVTLGDEDADAERFRRLVWEATKPVTEEVSGERHPDAGAAGPA